MLRNRATPFMQSYLKTKFLLFSIPRDRNGFTLIELFIVIIIVGILSTIALPSFLNQSNKARQSEAKTYVGSMNRAQQAYYLESKAFANRFDFLGLGINSSTQTYEYAITLATGAARNEGVTMHAKPAGAGSVKAYIGGVKIGSVTGVTEVTTLSVLCEAVVPSTSGGADGTEEVANLDSSVVGAPTCPETPGVEYKTVK